MTKITYSQKAKFVFRIFSLIAIVLLALSNTHRFMEFGFENLTKNKLEIFTFCINILNIFLFGIVVCFPEKIAVCAVIAFIYSVIIFIFEPQNNIALFLYFVSMVCLYARGFFNKHRLAKNIIASVVLIGLVLSELRFGTTVFIKASLDKMAYSFLTFIILFFASSYLKDVFDIANSDYKLDIQKFPQLKKRDAQWLRDILNGKKYTTIAIESQMNIGSVKNRFRYIFSELGVGDKQGFYNKYSDFEILYGDESLDEDSENSSPKDIIHKDSNPTAV